jgi:hypothetical protein
MSRRFCLSMHATGVGFLKSDDHPLFILRLNLNVIFVNIGGGAVVFNFRHKIVVAAA